MTFCGSQDVCGQVQIFPALSRFIINVGAVCTDLVYIFVGSLGIYTCLEVPKATQKMTRNDRRTESTWISMKNFWLPARRHLNSAGVFSLLPSPQKKCIA